MMKYDKIVELHFDKLYINPFALRTAKTPKSFGRSKCNRGYSSMFYHHLYDLLFASLVNEKIGLLSYGSKFFPLKADPD